MIDGIACPRSFSIFDVRGLDGHLSPVVCTSDDVGGWHIERGVLRFATYLRNRGDSLSQVHAKCLSLGLLRDFFLYAWQGDVARPLGLSDLCARFLRARRSGLVFPEVAACSETRWSPVRHETVSRDRRAIAEYAAFCVTHFEDFGILPLRGIEYEACRRDLDRLLVLKAPLSRGSDLLHHASSHRMPRAHLSVDPLGRSARRAQARTKAHLPIDLVRKVIDRTKSPMQKMLLIQAFFGGPRLSEMLNQWRCDVLPGAYRKELFPDDRPSVIPLVILAHPQSSTYTGDLYDFRFDRLQHLKTYYGLTPRSDLRGLPDHAGWKGIAFDNAHRLISQIFWVELSYAHFFESLMRDLRHCLYHNISPDIIDMHPYLFINDDPSRPEFGKPLKLNNARKIFARAFERVPEIGPNYQLGSHSARHAYKGILESLLPDCEEDIAKCMHHVDLRSQNHYAKNSAAARTRLNNAMMERGL